MEYGKFLMYGEDRRMLAYIKSALVSSGYIFVGYSDKVSDIIRQVRSYEPDVIIIEACWSLSELRQVLEVIDEDLLGACILIMETRDESMLDFLRNSRVITYMSKWAFAESTVQMIDILLQNYRKVCEYEQKIKKLSETLESRKVVEKAKWILVEQEGFSEADAYEVIKKKSRDNRMPMREIAEAIILTRSCT